MVSRLSLLLASAAMVHCAEVRAQSGPISRARQVTASFTFDLVPSPDGRRAVVIRVIAGREQLFTMNMDGTGETQITRDDADHEDPVWSPDGRRIAFVLVKGGKKIVNLIDADGTDPEAVTPASQSAIHPSFTPDGRAILYCTDDDLRPPAKNESQIYSIDLASKKVTMLISGGVNTFPVMSPNGRKIAYLSYDDAYSPPKAVEQARRLGWAREQIAVIDDDLGLVGRHGRRRRDDWHDE